MEIGHNQYAPMPGLMKLREQIAQKTEELYSAVYNPETEITIVPGATLGFFATINAENREKLPADVIEAKKKKAEETLAQLQAGTNFTTLAKQLSEDPTSRERGGEYVFQKGQMFPEFEKAVWDLKPGTLHSQVVTTQFGFHVFKKLEEVPARIIPLAEVTEQIRDLMIQRDMEVRIPEYGDRLRAEAHVKLLPGAPQPFQP